MSRIGTVSRPLQSAEPVKLARAMRADEFDTGESAMPGVWHWRGCFWVWSKGMWLKRTAADMRSAGMRWMEDKYVQEGDGVVRLAPTKGMAEELVFALSTISEAWWDTSPAWTTRGATVDAKDCVAFEDVVVEVTAERGVVVVGERGPNWFGPVVGARWEEGARSELWERCVSQWSEGEEGWSDLLRRALGYLVGNRKNLRKWVLFEGVAGGGKSVISRVLDRLVGGAPWMMHTTAETLAGDFGAAGLAHAGVVVLHELSKLDGREGEAVATRMKQVVGGDPVPINRKYQDVEDGVLCNAGVLVLSNVVPNLPNHAAGLSSKMLVVPFTRGFDGTVEVNPRLSEELAGELAGIAQWAVQGLLEVRRAGGKWPVSEKGQEVEREYRMATNEVDGFLEEYFVRVEGGFVPNWMVRKLWQEYVGKTGRGRSVGLKGLGAWIVKRATGWRLYADRRPMNGEYVRGLGGLSVRREGQDDA